MGFVDFRIIAISAVVMAVLIAYLLAKRGLLKGPPDEEKDIQEELNEKPIGFHK